MGGETTELNDATSTVVIEAAHFDAGRIFRTQKRHKLPTEGAKRWSVVSTRRCPPRPPTGWPSCWCATAAAPSTTA